MATSLDNRPDQESDNKIQQDYDDKFNELTSPEHMSKDGEDANLYDRENKPDEDKQAPLKPWEQAKLDQMETGLRENKLYQPEEKGDSKSANDKLKGAFTGKKKYGWIGGGIVGTLLAAFMFLFPVLGPTHIFKNLDGYHFEPNNHFSSRRARRVIKKIKTNFSQSELESPINKRLSEVDPDVLKNDLAKRGYDLELNADGSPVRITDPDGRTVGLDDADAFDILDDVLPLAKSAKRGFFRRYISGAFDFSWSGILRNTDPDTKIWKTIYDKTTGGKDFDPIKVNAQELDEDGNPIKNNDVDEANKAKTDIEEAAEIAAEKKAAGASDLEATKAGSKYLQGKLTAKSMVLGVFVTSCVVKAAYDNEIQIKYTNARAAITEIFDLAIISNEFQNHDTRSLDHVGDYFSKYNNERGTFASAGAWQEVTGQPVTGPGLNAENNVTTANANDLLGGVLGTVSGVGGFINQIPVLSQICGVFNAVAGTLIGSLLLNVADWSLAGLEIFAACTAGAVLSFGTTCAGRISWNVFFELGIPRLIAAVLNATAQKIIDNPVEALNFVSHAASFANSEMSRSGARVTNDQYDDDVALYMDYEQSKHDSLYDRYASLDNPNSLIFALATQKTLITGSIHSLSQAITAIATSPSILLNKTIAAFTGGAVYAQSGDNPHASIPKFTKNNMLESDPDEVTAQVVALLESSEDARNTALNCMGYDYETDTLDPNLQLPMYSNPGPAEDGFFAALGSALFGSSNAQTKNDLVRKYCIDGNTGNSPIDPNDTEVEIGADNYALIGRFVDDLMLAEQISEIEEGIE